MSNYFAWNEGSKKPSEPVKRAPSAPKEALVVVGPFRASVVDYKIDVGNLKDSAIAGPSGSAKNGFVLVMEALEALADSGSPVDKHYHDRTLARKTPGAAQAFVYQSDNVCNPKRKGAHEYAHEFSKEAYAAIAAMLSVDVDVVSGILQKTKKIVRKTSRSSSSRDSEAGECLGCYLVRCYTDKTKADKLDANLQDGHRRCKQMARCAMETGGSVPADLFADERSSHCLFCRTADYVAAIPRNTYNVLNKHNLAIVHTSSGASGTITPADIKQWQENHGNVAARARFVQRGQELLDRGSCTGVDKMIYEEPCSTEAGAEFGALAKATKRACLSAATLLGIEFDTARGVIEADDVVHWCSVYNKIRDTADMKAIATRVSASIQGMNQSKLACKIAFSAIVRYIAAGYDLDHPDGDRHGGKLPSQTKEVDSSLHLKCAGCHHRKGVVYGDQKSNKDKEGVHLDKRFIAAKEVSRVGKSKEKKK